MQCNGNNRRAVHGDRGQPVLHGAGGAAAELRAGGGHLERRRDPVHPPLRRAALLGRDGAGRGARHPPRQPGPAAGAVAADLRGRQEPRPPDAADGPQEATHRAASARYVVHACCPRSRRARGRVRVPPCCLFVPRERRIVDALLARQSTRGCRTRGRRPTCRWATSSGRGCSSSPP